MVFGEEPNSGSSVNGLMISKDSVRQVLRVPGTEDNKYTRGVVQLVTGSKTYRGASVLSVGGALAVGPGMVRFSGPKPCRKLVIARFPEVVLNAGSFGCAVVGSGWDQDQERRCEVIFDFAQERSADPDDGSGCAPVVVDAGALPFAQRWADLGVPLILTPHVGEANRLWDQFNEAGKIDKDAKRPKGADLATALASLIGAIVVLKSSTTWIADPSGLHSQFDSKSGWAGVAGSGDVLAGVIGAVVASSCHPLKAGLVDVVAAAVWIHGTAAMVASGVQEPNGMVSGLGRPIRATDIFLNIPSVIGDLLSSEESVTWTF